MIKPTVGRVVHFYPSASDGVISLGNQPQAAIIVFVHNDRMVNLVVFDHNGVPMSRTSVLLVQPGQVLPSFAHARWMDYQIGQAAKTESLQAALSAASHVDAVPRASS